MNVYNEIDPLAADWIERLIEHGHLAPGRVERRSIADLRGADVDATQAHFFAGIGGWPLALDLAGWPRDLPVWTGSCPCQPFSSAGKRRGFDDEKHLWPEFFRLIRDRAPAFVFGGGECFLKLPGAPLLAAPWASPIAHNAKGPDLRAKDKPGSDLVSEAFLSAPWATLERKLTSLSHQASLAMRGAMASGSRAPTGERVSLDPAHSRWLMGYPPAWDDCAAMVTRSSRK